ncbi:hypothetical protein [Trabulsiella odontotermitis]|uniref:hypothetical protein n=1 Tax=Trabulsiella odontotermitis TaxID=379893 RepID=UPI0006766519|nr:hypothetical protein [Trabulsiella odontotermitis]KNC89684.1 hypothetical protein GM30_06615 [Trabulsiella odontotermitis]
MATRIQIIFKENEFGITTDSSLDRAEEGFTGKELLVSQALYNEIIKWIETNLNAKEVTPNQSEGTSSVH